MSPVAPERSHMSEAAPTLSFVIPVGGSIVDVTQLDLLADSQEWDDVEWLVVVDGEARPELGVMLDHLKSRRDTRVLGSASSGPGPARNRGLAAACGDFVTFLDADDAADPHAYLELCRQSARCDAVIGVLGFREIDAGTGSVEASNSPRLGLQNGWPLVRRRAAVWRFTFRRDFLCAHGVTFPALTYGEDLLFLTQALTKQQLVMGLPRVGYTYRHHGLGQLSRQEASPDDVISLWGDLHVALSANRGNPLARRTLESWSSRIRLTNRDALSRGSRSTLDQAQFMRGLAWSMWWTMESPATLVSLVRSRMRKGLRAPKSSRRET